MGSALTKINFSASTAEDKDHVEEKKEIMNIFPSLIEFTNVFCFFNFVGW